MVQIPARLRTVARVILGPIRSRLRKAPTTHQESIPAVPPNSSVPNIPDLFDRFDQYETSVNLAIRDLLKPGDLFFDVGANLGGLSVTGARAVGPFGQVIAFEVSPRILPQLMTNLRHWNASNVYVMPNAVWNRSGDIIELFFGGAHYADTVMSPGANVAPDRLVKTIALDDMVETLGRAPSVVKMDIEGAELEALKGFRKTLDAHHPAMVLEMNSYVDPDKPAEEVLTKWLKQHGYRVFNADDCQPFETTSNSADNRLSNIICIHESDLERIHRYESVAIETVQEMTASGMSHDPESGYFDFGEQPPGRYLIEFEPSDTALDDHTITHMVTVAGPPWIPMNLHMSAWSHLSRSYTRQPFHLDLKGQIVVRFKDRPKEDIPGMVKSVSLKRLTPDGPKANGWPQAKFRL